MVLSGTMPAEPARVHPPRRPRRRVWAVGAIGVVVAILAVRQLVMTTMSAHSYEFIATTGDYPVTWDHCQAIRYTVNPKGAPEDWEDVVRTAIDDIEEASGFVFADRGTTVKRSLIGSRYDGNEWEPVLIMWSDRYQDQLLDGGTIGLGGSGAVDVNGTPRYVVGQVRLDSTVKDPEVTRLTLEHELAHVLGLAHVDDPHQLMHRSYGGQKSLGPGDIAGLERLHDVPCTLG
jgi:matrixin